jgi:hypothetical protein
MAGTKRTRQKKSGKYRHMKADNQHHSQCRNTQRVLNKCVLRAEKYGFDLDEHDISPLNLRLFSKCSHLIHGL